MTFEIALLLVFLATTLTLFLLEVLPVEVTALCLLAALFLSGIVTLEEALTGLSNEAVVTVGAMFVLSRALAKTGLLELGAERVAKAVGPRRWLGVALLTDVKLSDRELAEGGQVVVEGLVPPNSPLIGNTLADLDFRRRYGAFVLAIRRLGPPSTPGSPAPPCASRTPCSW